MADIVQILREMQQEEDCPMMVHMAFSEAISEITRLRAELASAIVYKPCRRKDTPRLIPTSRRHRRGSFLLMQDDCTTRRS